WTRVSLQHAFAREAAIQHHESGEHRGRCRPLLRRAVYAEVLTGDVRSEGRDLGVRWHSNGVRTPAKQPAGRRRRVPATAARHRFRNAGRDFGWAAVNLFDTR